MSKQDCSNRKELGTSRCPFSGGRLRKWGQILKVRRLTATLGFVLFLNVTGLSNDRSDTAVLTTVFVKSPDGSEQVLGRVLVEAQDGGVLLEERNGRIRQLTPEMIESKSTSSSPFSPMTNDELGNDLLAQASAGFEIHQTDHYVICSNSTDAYSEFVGKLLEKVFDQYFQFMDEQEILVNQPAGKLPVMILQSESELKEFAAVQHPETSFENTPGYYSLRENQMLLLDLTRDRNVRSSAAIRKRLAEQPLQVATIVHEAVHQLAFNTGLQTRMADNPVWLSEGLALYFEPIAPRSTSLWTRPGLVSSRHHPVFVQHSENGTMEIPLRELLSIDQTFLNPDTVAIAYAESWGLTGFLFRQQNEGMKKYLTKISRRKPLQRVSPEERISEFQEAFGKSPDEIEREMVSFVRRLRPPR